MKVIFLIFVLLLSGCSNEAVENAKRIRNYKDEQESVIKESNGRVIVKESEESIRSKETDINSEDETYSYSKRENYEVTDGTDETETQVTYKQNESSIKELPNGDKLERVFSNKSEIDNYFNIMRQPQDDVKVIIPGETNEE